MNRSSQNITELNNYYQYSILDYVCVWPLLENGSINTGSIIFNISPISGNIGSLK